MIISKLNKAKVVILDNEICRIIINKKQHKIIQTRQCNKDINKDCTEECEKMERECAAKDVITENVYKGGVIMSKLLNGRINKKCMKFIYQFNIQIE